MRSVRALASDRSNVSACQLINMSSDVPVSQPQATRIGAPHTQQRTPPDRASVATCSSLRDSPTRGANSHSSQCFKDALRYRASHLRFWQGAQSFHRETQRRGTQPARAFPSGAPHAHASGGNMFMSIPENTVGIQNTRSQLGATTATAGKTGRV